MPIPIYRGSNRDIERVADSIREKILKTMKSPPSTRGLLQEIVRRTGGTIEVCEDPSRQEFEGGSLMIRKDKDYTIYLSPFTTPLRDNFTIAHELGHLFLHFHLQHDKPALPMTFTRYGTTPPEWQANRFAAALLMPESEFRERHAKFNGDPYLLSGSFSVSMPSVEIRGECLGLPVKPLHGVRHA